MKIGNSGSKYDYQPRLLDSDIANKRTVNKAEKERLKATLQQFFKDDIRYHDNMPMSLEQRWGLLIDVAREIQKEYELG